MAIILDYITRLGFEHSEAEVENAHRTGKKQGENPRHIIAKPDSRAFKRKLLQAAKSADWKTELNEVRFAEDFTPSDFNSKLGKKLFDLCKRLFKKGREFVSQKEIFLWAEGQSRSCRNL